MNVTQAIAESGIGAREARLLLAQATGVSQTSLIAHGGRVLAIEAQALFFDWARRRQAGEPVAYILGRREFYGLQLTVTPAVLIPRPETELLVDLALARIDSGARPRILDLGTGSGAIALAIKQQRPCAEVMAVDSSAAALEVARLNAIALGLDIELLHGDWYQPVSGRQFSLIVSNPPYVATNDPHLGQGDVRFEPEGALVAGVAGLDAIAQIAAGACAHLAPGAWLLLEHGYDQATAVRERLAGAKFDKIETWPDLAGISRVSGGCIDPLKGRG